MGGVLKSFGELSRFKKSPERDRAIVFFAEHEGYYPYFEGLIDELIDRKGRSVSYITSDPVDPVLKSSRKGLNAYYIHKIFVYSTAAHSRVFVMTLTDLTKSQRVRSSENPVHYLYAFHALVSTHMMYRYGAFDNYDSILCVGPHQVEEIRRFEKANGLPPKQLMEAGYYRLERIYKAYQEYKERASSSGSGKTVLIAPSWGEENILESFGQKLVGLLLDAGYRVIVRPHPETVRRSPRLIKELKSLYSANPGFVLELSVRSDDSLLEADVMICDCSGVALEYSLGTERPVLFLDVPVKVKNRRYRELGLEPLELELRSEIGLLVSPDNLEEVNRIIPQLMTEVDEYRSRIRELRDKYVYNFGSSSEVGVRYILRLLDE